MEIQMTQSSLNKNIRELTLPDFKTYYEATVVKDRHIEQNVINGPTHIRAINFLERQQFSGRKIFSSTNGAETIGSLYAKEEPFITNESYTKI